MTKVKRRSILVLLALVAIACSPTLPSAGSWSLSPGPSEIALPTASWSIPSGAAVACAGVGLNAVLHGDPRDPRVAWLITDTEVRLDVIWLPGYHARFVPALEVLDATGAVVLHGGDAVTGGCVTGDPGVLFLIPPFK
jgi:hypothetical protein